MRLLLTFLAIISFSNISYAHEYTLGALQIQHPYTLLMPKHPANTPLGIFMTIKNNSDTSDRLVGLNVTSGKAEMHTMSVDDQGVMRMRTVDGFDIPAKGIKTLDTTQDHIMLSGHAIPKLGTKFPITLVFAKAGKIKVDISADPLETIPTKMDMPHDHHH